MKNSDFRKSVTYEYGFNKTEWIISCVMQCMIFSLVFFLLNLTVSIDDIAGNYYGRWNDSYEFDLRGFDEAGIRWLEKQGFHDIEVTDGYGTALTDSLHFIWFKKLVAVSKGMDIFNSDIDEALEIIFFFRLAFVTISVVLLTVMFNNLSNSYAFRLEQRKKYIQMLHFVGLSNKNCKKIFSRFFTVRNTVAVATAYGINLAAAGLMKGMLSKHLSVGYRMPAWSVLMAAVFWLVSQLIMSGSINRQWKRCEDDV